MSEYLETSVAGTLAIGLAWCAWDLWRRGCRVDAAPFVVLSMICCSRVVAQMLRAVGVL